MSTGIGPDEATIREQAYYFWEQDGRPHGRDAEHWMRAVVAVTEKQQLQTLTEAPPKRARTTPSPKAKLAAGRARPDAAKAARPKK